MKEIKKVIGKFPRQLLQKPLPKISCFFVAEEGGKIVGCCALEVYSRKIAEIRSLAVIRRFQGQGIGGKLIDACVRRAKKRRVGELLAISGSIGLFSKFGFDTFNEQKFALLKYLKAS